MSKPTLDSLAAAKAKLEQELRQLEQQETELRQQQATDAFADVMSLLGQYGEHFNARQKAEIVTAVGAGSPARVKAPAAAAKREVAPKYWLPHNGETWTGRGRTPRAFVAWEGTAAYRDWKAGHPDEKFPKYPG